MTLHDDGDEFLDRIITDDETCVAHITPEKAAVNALASQWNSLQDEVQADFVCAESDMHGVLGQAGSNPRRQTSTTQGYKS